MRVVNVAFIVCCAFAVTGLAQAAEMPEADQTLLETQISSSFAASASESDELSGFESYCVADCGEYPDVSCDGSTCSAVNRNCSNHQRGYVVCDGLYTYCPACPVCENGEIWLTFTGKCCPEGDEEAHFYECVNEHWVLLRVRCMPSPKCPLLP